MITVFIRRVLPIVGLLALMGALVGRMQVPDPTGDLFFHLRFGDEFRHGWSIASPGNLSPFDTADWVPTQWLAQVGLSWLFTQAGLGAVLWLAGTLMLILLVTIHRMCREVAAPLPAALATIATVLSVLPGLSPRPQLISFIFIVIVTDAWLRTSRDGRARWWLLAVAWVWPLLHGMWTVGIVIGAASVAGMALDRSMPQARLVRLATIPALSALVPLLSPLGPSLYASQFTVGSRSTYFAEWATPDLFSPDRIWLLGLFAVVIVAGLKARRSTWVEVLLLGQAIVWALYTVRTGNIAALLLAPLAAQALQGILPAAGPLRWREQAVVVGGAALGSVALALTAGANAVDSVVPQWLDARLDALPAQTRILNDWDTGSYFLWRHPDLHLVMHGYGDVFTDEEIERNGEIIGLEPGWEAAVADLDVDYALQQPEAKLTYALTEHLGWTVIEEDDAFVLLAPPD